VTCIKQYIDSSITIPDITSRDSAIEFSIISQIKEIQVVDTSDTRATDYKGLGVTLVQNGSTNCCYLGLCGQASIAMMVNYYKGTTLTAKNVHDAYKCLTSNYHNEQKAALVGYGLTVTGPNRVFTYPNIKSNINANTLLLLDLQTASNAHNVVVRGYYSNTSDPKLYFYHIDPNTGDNICSLPANAYDPVVVPLGGYNYIVDCYITGKA